jgi:hypothetical protein
VSNDLEKQAKSIANSSGFPLQIRVANLAKSSSQWQILLEEHPWYSSETNSAGFIDIVLRHKIEHYLNMVIECKCVRQTEWVFLIPEVSPNKRTHARIWDSSQERFDWWDWQVEPSSYESLFCSIPGQVQGRGTLIERTASELIESVEALALQDKKIIESRIRQPGDLNLICIPIIVTTAKLMVSFFEPESISLEDGSLPSDARFEIVPCVRFRKSLTARFPLIPPPSLQEVHRKTVRTVFIVNSEHFLDFIEELSIR